MCDDEVFTHGDIDSVDENAVRWCREILIRMNSLNTDDAANVVTHLMLDDSTCSTWINFIYQCTTQEAFGILADTLNAFAMPCVIVNRCVECAASKALSTHEVVSATCAAMRKATSQAALKNLCNAVCRICNGYVSIDVKRAFAVPPFVGACARLSSNASSQSAIEQLACVVASTCYNTDDNIKSAFATPAVVDAWLNLAPRATDQYAISHLAFAMYSICYCASADVVNVLAILAVVSALIKMIGVTTAQHAHFNVLRAIASVCGAHSDASVAWLFFSQDLLVNVASSLYASSCLPSFPMESLRAFSNACSAVFVE